MTTEPRKRTPTLRVERSGHWYSCTLTDATGSLLVTFDIEWELAERLIKKRGRSDGIEIVYENLGLSRLEDKWKPLG